MALIKTVGSIGKINNIDFMEKGNVFSIVNFYNSI